MNVLTAIRERMLSWAGHVARMDYKEICAKALRCRGLQWWRWRQLHWKEVEKDKWSGPHPQRFKIYRWEDMVAGEVSKFTGNADGLSDSVQENTGWLHFAQNRGRWKQFSKCGRSPDGPGCLGDPCASGLTGTNAGATWSARGRNERWYRAGYGWLDSYGSGYGRRRGCGGITEDVWFCVTCRMVPCRCGVEVLSWKVSGNEFLSQSSLLKTEVLKLGMTDFFHLGELIPRPRNEERSERTTARASCAHDGDKQMDEPKHRTRVFAQPLYLSCVKF